MLQSRTECGSLKGDVTDRRGEQGNCFPFPTLLFSSRPSLPTLPRGSLHRSCTSWLAQGKVWCCLVGNEKMSPLLSTSLCSASSAQLLCGHPQQHRPELPVLQFLGLAVGVAVATPSVAQFFEGHSHGNGEHYAMLANIHSDSFPSCLCPTRQQHLVNLHDLGWTAGRSLMLHYHWPHIRWIFQVASKGGAPHKN